MGFDVFLQLCDDEGEVDRGLTIKETYNAFLPCLEKYRNGVKESRINWTGITKYGLSDEEAFFILAYSSGTSKWINAELRLGKELSTNCKKLFSEQLDYSLSKMPSLNESLVYRMQIGIERNSEIKRFQSRVNSTFIVPQYLSTAKENYNNSAVVWKIKTLTIESKGKDISDLSNHRYEKEVLFERNSKFEITAVDELHSCIMMQEISSTANVDFDINALY